MVREKLGPFQVYAMKILRKSDLCNAHRIKAVRMERDILATIKHPNVVGLKFAFQDKKQFYFVMEYCCGKINYKCRG